MLAETLRESGEAKRLELRACIELLSFGWQLGLSREEAERLFASGRELARRSERPDLEAILFASFGRVLSATLNADAYVEHAAEALKIARGTENPRLEVGMLAILSQALRHAGRLAEGLKLSEEALRWARQHPDQEAIGLGFSAYLWLLTMRAQTFVLMGRLDEAQRDVDEVIQGATSSQEGELLVAPRYAYTGLCWVRGEALDALDRAREAQAIAEKLGSPISLVMAKAALAVAYLLNKEAPAATALLEEALALSRDRRVGMEIETPMLVYLADARLLLGDVQGAHGAADLAADVARRRHARAFECQAELCRARMRLHSGGNDADAAAALAKALRLARETGAKVFEPFIHCELGELARLRGDMNASAHELQVAQHLFEAMSAPQRAAMVRASARPP